MSESRRENIIGKENIKEPQPQLIVINCGCVFFYFSSG